MGQTHENLPTCLWCKLGHQSFPCRDDDGNIQIDRLAEAFLILSQEDAGSSRYDENFWSFDCVNNIIREAPETAFQFIVLALSIFTTDREIAVLAAGPLEDFVYTHGEKMIGKIEREASGNARFRYLLSGIWGQSHVNPAIWQRIQTAVGEGPWLDADPRTPQGSRKARKAD